MAVAAGGRLMCHGDWAASVGPGRGVALDVGGTTMPGWWYEPATPSGRPVVLVPDIYGPIPFYRELAGRLADDGHATLLVDQFHRQGALAEIDRDLAFQRMARLDAPQALDDLDAVLDRLGGTRGQPTGILGFCIGGHLALDLAARRDDLAVASFYGFPEDLPAAVGRPAPRPVDQAATISGPIVGFWGDQDYIPVEVIERFGRAMSEHGVPYEGHVLEGAGHGFLQGIVEDRPDSQVARWSWGRTRSFFTEHLGG